MNDNGTNNARELEILVIQGIMGSEGGRDFIHRLLEQTGVDDDTFTPDPLIHAHKAGQRSTGVWLRSELIEASLDNYVLMLKEHKDG